MPLSGACAGRRRQLEEVAQFDAGLLRRSCTRRCPGEHLDQAAKVAGFTPRVIPGKTPKRLFVTNRVNDEVKVNVAALTAAVRQAKLEDVNIPADWDGVAIGLQQQPGIIIDYGDFYVAEGAPRTLTAPPGFPVSRCLEVLFRLMGIGASPARALRQAFDLNPTTYLPIAARFDMDIQQVPLPAGSGLLLQNADKGGELAFMWTSGERSYFLTGLVAEDEVIAIAKALQ